MQPSTLIQKAQQLLTALALTLTLAISAQNLSQFDKLSDDQLINYMRQYEGQGLTEDQLILAAKAKGASDADIEKFRARLQKLKSASTADFQGTGVAAETTFFGVTKESTEVKGKSAVFGASFFQKAQANQSPNLNPATPEQYQLGPGDQISIVLWGAASNVFQETINVNGQIVIEGVGPITSRSTGVDKSKVWFRVWERTRLAQHLGHRSEFCALNVACAQRSEECTCLNWRELFRQPGLHERSSVLLRQNVSNQQLLK